MVNGQKIVAIIQCRLGSSRLPAKAMLDLGGKTLLERTIKSIRSSSLLDEIWVATSTGRSDDLIEWKAAQAGVQSFSRRFRGFIEQICTVRSKGQS